MSVVSPSPSKYELNSSGTVPFQTLRKMQPRKMQLLSQNVSHGRVCLIMAKVSVSNNPLNASHYLFSPSEFMMTNFTGASPEVKSCFTILRIYFRLIKKKKRKQAMVLIQFNTESCIKSRCWLSLNQHLVASFKMRRDAPGSPDSAAGDLMDISQYLYILQFLRGGF